jgi:hypothetical protein
MFAFPPHPAIYVARPPGGFYEDLVEIADIK